MWLPLSLSFFLSASLLFSSEVVRVFRITGRDSFSRPLVMKPQYPGKTSCSLRANVMLASRFHESWPFFRISLYERASASDHSRKYTGFPWSMETGLDEKGNYFRLADGMPSCRPTPKKQCSKQLGVLRIYAHVLHLSKRSGGL